MMATMKVLFLMYLGYLLRLDILVWIIAVPLVVLALFFIYVQLRNIHRQKRQLEYLAKVKGHTIEYDLVMKTMKLSVWRLDMPTLTVSFESDYRDMSNSLSLPPGTSLSVVIDHLLPEYRKDLDRGLQGFISGTLDEFHMEYKMRIPHSDRCYWGELYATVDQRDLNGNVVSIVGTTMRIDRQKEIEQALIDARNHAEESDRLKSAFLANVSHEIRTPLNAIVGFSEVLSMAKTAEERDQLVTLIKQNNAQLLRLFDDMLNMSKLEAGDEAANMASLELNKLLAEVADRFSEKATSKGLTLQTELKPVDPMPVTDRRRVSEILNQYVDNAIKFTDEGSVTLGYDVRNDSLRIWVRDTGKGIAQKDCNDHLFERFVKVDDFVPGTGLGLSICRSLALSIDGKVGIESEFGKGSCFWVDLPLK